MIFPDARYKATLGSSISNATVCCIRKIGIAKKSVICNVKSLINRFEVSHLSQGRFPPVTGTVPVT
jgi:hypothetical protein